MSLSITIVAVVVPIFSFMLIYMSNDNSKSHIHSLAVLSNFIAAGLVLYIGMVVPNKLYPVMVALIFVIFFGLYLYRFSKLSTILLVSSYSLCFLMLIFQYGEIQGIDLWIAVAYSIVIPVFAISASHTTEKKDRDLFISHELIRQEKDRSDKLLLNILPEEIAYELKERGATTAQYYDNVTILFTDFVNFTTAGERLGSRALVEELHSCFKAYDEIMDKYGIEKIKTIGDAYLAVCGLPAANKYHAEKVVRAAQDISTFMLQRREQLGDSTFEVRIGVHSGSAVAGIVGVKKFAYDIWGDTVNTAARMEQNSEAGKINISQTTYELVQDKFTCTYRGELEAKNKGKLKMYFVEG